jgi:thiamine-monophosphate kinase
MQLEKPLKLPRKLSGPDLLISGRGPVPSTCSGLANLSEIGELGLLAELERRGLIAGLDAEGAVFPDGRVVTQDTVVEGVHFPVDFESWRELGYKAVAVNLSDLAAMGAEPEGLAVTLAAPAATTSAAITELYEGLNEPGVPVLAGDLSSSSFVSVTVTALGRSERVPGRAGARPGDVLVVTGPLGGAAAGFYVMAHELDGFDELVERQRRPPFRLDEGRRLARVAHAMIDISDGILSDARRIAERSGVRLVIDPEAVPRAEGIERVADQPFWTMGDDYELLAALTPEDARVSGFTIVGQVEEGSGVDPELPRAGWDAFRS